MKIVMPPGKYVLAVSGGVDSMVLLDMLRRLPDVELVVAHYDHGIRPDSDADRQLVQSVAAKHNLSFESSKGNLGTGVSEDTARKARYAYLNKVRDSVAAQAIITAHHQDDVLETVMLNMLRGTGRKGLTSLKSTDVIVRPLLHVPKQGLISYAQAHGLTWREDPTNQSLAYKRNYVRQQLASRLDAQTRQKLLTTINNLLVTNAEIDQRLAVLLDEQLQDNTLDRSWFIALPHAVAREIMMAWLRTRDVQDLTSQLVERLVAASKTLAAGKQIDVDKHHILRIYETTLALEYRDR
jgi:tRNA(Ile)-lysidine synthase